MFQVAFVTRRLMLLYSKNSINPVKKNELSSYPNRLSSTYTSLNQNPSNMISLSLLIKKTTSAVVERKSVPYQ